MCLSPMFSSVPFSLEVVALAKRKGPFLRVRGCTEEDRWSRLEVSGVLLAFKDGQTPNNPHAIEDGQQVMSNDSQEKRPQKQTLSFWGGVLPEPELTCNEWNKRFFYRKNQ